MHPERLRLLKEGPAGKGPVVYWMSRDQRTRDNWALLYAQDLAVRAKAPLIVVFCLVPEFLGATLRPYAFMLQGLRGVESDLVKAADRFSSAPGKPGRGAAAVSPDGPGRRPGHGFRSPADSNGSGNQASPGGSKSPFTKWTPTILFPAGTPPPNRNTGPIPCGPRFNGYYPNFWMTFPPLRKHPFFWKEAPKETDWPRVVKTLKADPAVTPVSEFNSGEKAARQALKTFIESRLASYDDRPQRSLEKRPVRPFAVSSFRPDCRPAGGPGSHGFGRSD